MSILLWSIFGSVTILFMLINFQGGLVPKYQGLKWGLGGRDAPVDKADIQGRADRTVQNHIEGMLLYIPLAMIAHTMELDGKLITWGAGLYLIGRALFIPAYLNAWSGFRSGFWAIGMLGTLMVAAKILMAAL